MSVSLPVREPDVTVIVIVYNDAGRLARAVRSVLAQSLAGVEVVIVDDASTDATPRVAARLAAGRPDRVRVITLPENSGGCGRPRNAGMEQARGRYVMFLDSDDTLDPHACRNLVSAAEETGAELVSGRCVRVLPEREQNWYPSLYRESRVVTNILDEPDLLYDTLSTNKCYRRDFLEREGLLFVDRLHYEDLLFSAQAYVSARKIAIIPHRVYNWLIVPRGETLSITHRRAELRNFADRLEIHRRIDATFRIRGAEELAKHKNVKFVNHDLLLYLRELRSRDPDYREAFLELAQGYLATMDTAVFEECNPMAAIAGFLVGQGDLDGAIAAADRAPRRDVPPTLSIAPVERDGLIYWSEAFLDTAPGRRILDVTDLGIHSVPLEQLRLGGRLTAMRTKGHELSLAGDFINPLGRIGAATELTGRLEIRDRRRKGRAFRVPVTLRHEGDRIGWQARFAPVRRIRPIGLVDQTWGLWLCVDVGEETVVVRLTSTGTAHKGVEVPVRPRLTRIVGDRLEAYVADSGELAFRIVGRRLPARAVLPLIRDVARTGLGVRFWRSLIRAEKALRRRLTGRATKIAVFNRVLVRLPVRKGTVVFESHLGAQYSDNPKYVHLELRRRGTSYRAIWSYDQSRRGFPKDAVLVKRGSWAYYRALARAEFWVDNQGFPAGLTKRRQTTYIQTWHGSAYKRMGFDEPSVKQGTRAEHVRRRTMAGRFDHFVVRSEHDVRTLAGGLGVTAPPLRAGYPRNDPLVSGGDPEELAELRRRLGLDGDARTVVLYAPTFRADEEGRPVARFEPPFDLERFARELGDSHVLLIRAHYLSTAVVPPGLRGTVVDVGGVHDVTPLLLLADALVTDYSSVMFDYALRDRPMIFYTPDGDDYALRRGAYFDLAAHAPGPIVADEDGLFAALADLDHVHRDHADRRRLFTERFGEYDTGTAAKAIVERFFTGGGRD
ncbi:bifunctional glycosyltransferase/CDP-glycerol:glycerophosphate glycerophosphotransferase [Actinoallomurus sp. CA-142502]|uniref:bifunctional glycosyltransferase/CDP-glycerol:glycerophosphate glycerophosphotransferase n=1 Tax=Actinoallomurus sp. CA-142502 TaxID=3239885 RepID=UPI003D91C368